MSKYLDFFEEVYYINLERRIDRKELFEKRSKQVGIDATRFLAIEPDPNDPFIKNSSDPRKRWKLGCTLSHQEIIKNAIKLNLKNVLIFEDDCIFLDGFEEKAKKCANDLKNVEWDLMYFGGQPNNYCVKITENLSLIQNGGVYTTHAYAVNNTFYEKMISVDPKHVDTIDILLLNYDVNSRKCLLSKEILAIQDATYSDLWDSVIDSSNYMIRDWNKFVTKNNE